MIVQDYELIEEIGSGSFSTVYKAQHVKTKEFFAIKKMREMPHNNFQVVQNQIELLKRIQHRNIVRYETDFKIKGKWYIVFEYCGKGDLQNFKSKQGKLPQAFCKNLAYSLVQALQVVHENKIVHRDLKLANILINDSYDFKLADFGFSKDNQMGIMESFCGTPFAMPPQILNRETYDEKCDTWSLGIMIYQLIYGRLPFLPGKQFGTGIIGITNCILSSEPKYDSVDVSEECKDFIRLCLKKNKKERPKMSSLRKHIWVNSGIQSQVRRQFLMSSLTDKEEVKNRAKQVFNGAISEHIVNLIKYMKFVGQDVKWNLKMLEHYYPNNLTIRMNFIMMIAKKIKELMDNKIQIQIEDQKIFIELKYIKAFNTHIDSLKQVLSSELKEKKLVDYLDIEKQITKFVVSQSQACLGLTENIPNKIKLIYNLSQLPLKKPIFSRIELNWSFNENCIGIRKEFQNYLGNLEKEELMRFINQSYCEENIHQNWLVNHEFHDEKREGKCIEIGEYISRVIQINYPQQN